MPERLPRGRHGLSREQVRLSQRTRMLEAMAFAVAERGYVSVSVSDVITRAGVSRETFYEHFAGKEDCFLQTLEEAAVLLRQAIESSAVAPAATGEKRYEHMLDAYLATLTASPELARAVLVESFGAGEKAIAYRFAAQRRFVELTQVLLGARDNDERFACEMLVGAISALVTSRVATGRTHTLPELRDPIMHAMREGTLGKLLDDE